jgi:hypothetical protein
VIRSPEEGHRLGETAERVVLDPRSPILLTGLSSAAILSRTGTVTFIRETRGADLDWAGVYGDGVRLTGPWWIRLRTPEGGRWNLAETLVRLTTSRTRATSRHKSRTFLLDQEIVALPDAPAVGRSLAIASSVDHPQALTLESGFRPELAPVLIEGIKPFDYLVQRRGPLLRVVSFGSALECVARPPPTRWLLNDRPWADRSYAGELDSIGSETDLVLEPGKPVRLDWLVTGGLETTVRAHGGRAAGWLASARHWAPQAEARWNSWIERTPNLQFPDDPGMTKAYDLARSALRALYFAPEPRLVGLVAGYPWYAALWCRDIAWMLPAVLWLGDHEWAARTLRSVFRFQAMTALPLLGGERGELPMQIAPGPIFLYGTSDTTLYYADLVRRHAAHARRTDLARELGAGLARVEEWARARLDPATGLIRNGGEAALMRDAARMHGRVHYGFDAKDTTIWDSTDRRDHAIDVQILWMRTLSALAELEPFLDGALADADRGREIERLGAVVRDRYAWPQERYLLDSLRSDGEPVAKLRPNALRAVSAGLLDPAWAREVVARAAGNDLSTPWGIRTLSSRDPAFNPIAYHDGEVWTIATAWAADAAFAAGDQGRALAWLRQIAGVFPAESGLANECYRGDRPEAFNSCFLLGFSVAPFLSLLFERVWGLESIRLGPSGSDRPVLRIAPSFPPGWHRASLQGLRLGSGRLSLRWSRPSLRMSWHGRSELLIESAGQALKFRSGDSREIAVTAREPASTS